MDDLQDGLCGAVAVLPPANVPKTIAEKKKKEFCEFFFFFFYYVEPVCLVVSWARPNKHQVRGELADCHRNTVFRAERNGGREGGGGELCLNVMCAKS